jgi:CRP-like cAMP-binding protein
MSTTPGFKLLEVLKPEDRQDLIDAARRHSFDRNDVLIHEGDRGDSLHLIAKGHVAVRVTTPSGDIVTLLVLRAGDCVGELAVLSSGPRGATVVALDSVETLTLHSEQVNELRARHAQIDRVLVEALVAQVRALTSALVDALHLPVEKRLWRRMLDLAAIYGDGTTPIAIPLTQEELAQFVGSTRPTANRALRTAESEGVLSVTRGRVKILDLDGLAEMAR